MGARNIKPKYIEGRVAQLVGAWDLRTEVPGLILRSVLIK